MDELLGKLKLHDLNSGAFVAGKWLKCSQQAAVLNPACNVEIAKTTLADIDQMDFAIESAKNISRKWALVPAPKRGELIYQFGNILREKKDILGSLVALETGKSKKEADGEVQEMIDMANFAVGQSRMLYGKTMHSERSEHRMYEQWHPLGVVGIITAFNFPVAVWAWNAFLALVCGNVVIWKPSVKAPLSAIFVTRVFQQVIKKLGYDSSIISLLVTEDERVINRLVESEDVNLISFTGSTEIGREVGVKVARRMGKSLLELGGNNAAIVMPDANLLQVVPAVVFGAIGTSGQRCTTLRRLFVHTKVYKQVINSLIDAYQQIIVGDPLDDSVHMGPLIDKKAVNGFSDIVSSLDKEDILFGGEVVEGDGNFVLPTIVKANMNLKWVFEENFVPILWIIEVDNLEQALEYHNNSKHGLSSAIFTKKIKYMEYFLSVLGSDCGIACINQSTSGAEIGGAFGGEKHTGGGREAGSDAWKAYMRRQTVTINYGNKIELAQGIDFNK